MSRDRAAQGGGVARPLPALQVTGGMGAGGGADWFGPGVPMNPVAPPEVRGRRTDFPAGYNLQQRPRAYEAISMEMLRAMADGYDLLRLAIETRKDQLARLDWTIQPKDKKAKADEKMMARAAELTEFFQSPDQVHDWDTWLRLILEDLFVLDAPAIYVRPNKGGGVYGFKPMNGAEMKRVIDDWGDTPLPPYAAYQQNLKGLAAVNYTSDQLVYRPRNPRTNKIYGYSPVEQVIMIVNIALRRETWQLNFFTSGNLPDALIGVPDDWTPDQITEFQEWFDNRLAGDASKRRGGTFVPGDVAKSFVQTKENELFGKAEEWLARVICFCFNISPQALVKEVNRATADTAKDTAEEEGLEPLKKWIKRLIDYLLKKYLGASDFHFAWAEEVEIEAKTQSDINVAETGKSLMTINEARKSKGLDPFADPIFDQPMFLASDGWVPADPEAAFELATRKAEMQARFAPKTVAPGEDDPDGGPPSGGGKPGAGKPGAPKPGAAGKPAPKPGKDKAVKKTAEGSGGLGSPGDDGEVAGSASGVEDSASPPVQKFAVRMPSVTSPTARRIRKSIATRVAVVLQAAGDDVAAQVVAMLKDAARKLAKGDDPSDHGDGILNDDRITTAVTGVAVDVEEILRRLNLTSLEAVVDVLDDELFDLAVDSATKALAGIGVRVEGDLVNQVNQAAVEFARERSAELVGKRWVNGILMDNPNAAYRISDTTREMLRGVIGKGLEDNIGTPAIADAIQESAAFSVERADLIARTEVSNANEQSKLTGWRIARDQGVKLKKSWLTSGNENCCEACAANQAQGVIDLDDEFQSGDDAAPAHPNCMCVTVPEVEASAEPGGD